MQIKSAPPPTPGRAQGSESSALLQGGRAHRGPHIQVQGHRPGARAVHIFLKAFPPTRQSFLESSVLAQVFDVYEQTPSFFRNRCPHALPDCRAGAADAGGRRQLLSCAGRPPTSSMHPRLGGLGPLAGVGWPLTSHIVHNKLARNTCDLHCSASRLRLRCAGRSQMLHAAWWLVHCPPHEMPLKVSSRCESCQGWLPRMCHFASLLGESSRGHAHM